MALKISVCMKPLITSAPIEMRPFGMFRPVTSQKKKICVFSIMKKSLILYYDVYLYVKKIIKCEIYT